MTKSAGWILSLIMLGAVAAVLVLNWVPNHKPTSGSASVKGLDTRPITSESVANGATESADAESANADRPPFREYFIGEPVERENEALEIAAVYFPAVPMEGMELPHDEHALHVEADVRALANNRQGFALGQFIPYMKIRYQIAPVDGGEPLTGDLVPMVARDGLHYGATIVLPRTGRYQLTYSIQPPSVGGLGRHDDPVTGVAPWWKPFEVSWDWDYQGFHAADDESGG